MPVALKWTLQGLGLLLLGTLLLLLAWVAFNNPLADSKPRPRPAALQVKMRDVPDDSNAFFVQLGLRAPAGEDPASAGRRLWSAGHLTDTAQGLPLPHGTVWDCDGAKRPDCTSLWVAQPDALARELAANVEFARRCDRLTHFVDDEELLLPPLTNGQQTELPNFAPLMACNKLFRARAVMNAQQGGVDVVVADLSAADDLARMQLAGSHSLLSSAMAWMQLRRNWQTALALSARRPLLADGLERLVRPLAPDALSSQRWVAGESLFVQAVMQEFDQACKQPQAQMGGWAGTLWCNFHVGLLPNATAQAFDQQWLDVLAASQLGMPAALNAVPTQTTPLTIFGYLHWRNTVGSVLIAVAPPQVQTYLARQADVDLHREAALLALRMAAQHVRAAEREDWLNAQALPATVRSRLSLDGEMLIAKPWLAEVPGSTIGSSQAIRVPLTLYLIEFHEKKRPHAAQ